MSEEKFYGPAHSATQQGARPDGRGWVREVPEEEVRSYYGQPVLKEPTWTWEIPAYLFNGGLAGASADLSLVARLAGNRGLARRALLVALGGAAVSPVLLISNLGGPERFYEMLRVLKPTSPMSVGTWVLSAFGTSTAVAAASDMLGIFLRAGRFFEALLGPALSTYTAVLIADISVPVWHEARRELPLVFAASSAASAGAAAAMLTPVESADPARRRRGPAGDRGRRADEAPPGRVPRRALREGRDEALRQAVEGPLRRRGSGGGPCRAQEPDRRGRRRRVDTRRGGAGAVGDLQSRLPLRARSQVHRHAPARAPRSARRLARPVEQKTEEYVLREIVIGAAAGTTAPNALTYGDMLVRGRPSSGAPGAAVHFADKAGVDLASDEIEQNRRSRLGVLLGIFPGPAGRRQRSGVGPGHTRPEVVARERLVLRPHPAPRLRSGSGGGLRGLRRLSRTARGELPGS